MPLIFITGISTSGKSTIAKELQKLGYEAYDTEHNGISAWFNKQTGERVAEFGEMPERTSEWLSRHHWLIDKVWVAKMAEKAKDKLVFLCGGAANEPEVRNLCQKVIWLKTNEATIRQRVAIPRDHDYGTKPHELARAIEANMQKEAEYEVYGASIIDATQPMKRVVSDVLSACNWYAISSKIVHHSPWMDLHEDEVVKPNGERGTYTYVKSPPFVLIVAFDGSHFIMVRQYRYPVSRMMTEFPGGSIDEGETPLEAARREFEEETGLRAKKLTEIGILLNPNRATVFFAEDLEEGQHKMSEDGIETCLRLSREEIDAMIARGELTDSKTLACVLLFDRYNTTTPAII